MPQFFVAIQHPRDFVPSFNDETLMRDISALNQEIIASGIAVVTRDPSLYGNPVADDFLPMG